jgi:fluoroacetyl-CoA thioesterase
MKDGLAIGLEHTMRHTVDKGRTIGFMGEDLRVYATPSMTWDVELACRDLLVAFCDDGEDSVGARVELDHLGPTLLGQEVVVTARVTEIALPRVTFDVQVRDELDHVGSARHIRFVVDKSKQATRLARKVERLKAAGRST